MANLSFSGPIAFFALFSALFSEVSEGCGGLAASYMQGHVQMVSEAVSVVVAENDGYSIDGESVSFHFNTVETLKGDERRHFNLDYLSYPDAAERLGFVSPHIDHASRSFWLDLKGRVGYAADCNIYPTFERGKRYLIFLTEKPSLRSFEEIENESDLWYLVVLDAVRTKAPTDRSR